jgi:2-C-methyl-D-erythritol 2,4-cyclodiphosphate synthase
MDAHRFGAGKRLVLGGIEFASEVGLEGHSDADVVLHSLMDAMLGACGAGDIGELFPDDDPAYEGVSSLALLKDVCRRVRTKGYVPENIDIVVVCETPKIAPHRDEIRTSIAAACGLDPSTVSVKGTTTEGMGFAGRGEGIAAISVVLLMESS